MVAIAETWDILPYLVSTPLTCSPTFPLHFPVLLDPLAQNPKGGDRRALVVQAVRRCLGLGGEVKVLYRDPFSRRRFYTEAVVTTVSL